MKIPVNLTINQLKKIIKEAEENMEKHPFADDIITFHVEVNYLKVTQPIQTEELGNTQNIRIFDKPINTTYSK